MPYREQLEEMKIKINLGAPILNSGVKASLILAFHESF